MSGMFFAARTRKFRKWEFMRLFNKERCLSASFAEAQRRKGGKSGAEKRYAFEAELKSKRFQEGAYYVRKAIFR